ncbi:GspH/FimT family pseudopilin [Allofranklinella schreckenbergeri]|uniref:GspH/FimT family pseudopilin n=1 Tax=Allofranklinella schreckenbergeri TaxID=1076744 RepID=UPI0023B0980F|nr:GspH/FimT family pseudopilin [Allofranklinella schreckenbergeri]
MSHSPLAPRVCSKAPRRWRAARGFTLVELLVVIAIAAMLAALAPMAYVRIQESAQYRDAVRSLWTSLRTLREEALVSGQVQRFELDLQAKRFNYGSKTYTLAPELELRATVADLGQDATRSAAIWFLPEGGATGGSIEILRPTGDGTRVRVDWLTGDITQEALLP